ncbi:HEAT repeat domain-containing protein [Cohnella endophytica]|uniref:HEAT repeat domain-containing protein n=1 Tax=Cohnella endophytica TaxID=2419778 RepID=A0A494XGU3_9BACL|nr:HEAT repeat domain-containing protein [Cohnella endophytica]RKP49965.1 HEAT repeat domain-containing protein [Cohnella endophytica]
MSIELLYELNQEVRRLFIAGGKLAQGDMRLERLQPSLRKMGESAPVFARVAQAVEQTTNPKAENPSAKLLELATLLQSILYTQGQTETNGVQVPLQGASNFKNSAISYRKLSPVLDALTEKGQGRLEIIRQAHEDGLFLDYRLLIPAVNSLDESFAEISDFLESRVIPLYGKAALPVLKERLRLDGGKGDSRRLRLIHSLQGQSDMMLYLEAAKSGSQEVRTTAIELLGDYPIQEQFLLEQADDRRKEVRRAALLALTRIGTPKASDRMYEALISKDRQIAIEPIAQSRDESLIIRVIQYAAIVFDKLKQTSKDEETIEQLLTSLEALRGHRTEGIFELLRSLLSDKAFVGSNNSRLLDTAAQLLVGLHVPEAQAFAVSLKDMHKNKLLDYSFIAALQSLPPEEAYEQFVDYFTGNNKAAAKLLLGTLHHFIPTVYARLTDEGQSDSLAMDPRWLNLFMKMDEAELVSRLAYKPDRQTVNYLKSKCEGRFGYGNDPAIHAFLALFRIGYKEAPELLARTITPEAYNSYYYLYEPHVLLLKMLPGSYSEWLERFAVEEIRSDSMRRQLREVADFIRTKPIELQEDQKGWVQWMRSKMF